MKGLNFSKGIRRLEIAFSIQPLSDERIKLYFEKTSSLTDERWEQIIERIIETEDRFPAIATILKASDCNIGVKFINGDEYRDGYRVIRD